MQHVFRETMLSIRCNMLRRVQCLRYKYRHVSNGLPEQTEGDKTIVVEKLGSLTMIGLNRPEKRNSINTQTAKLLKEILLNFEEDTTSYVAVLHGIGGNFCSGEDLDEISNLNETEHLETVSAPNSSLLGIPLRLIKKPLIAAISGYAVGGGFELALMCDLRVIEDNALMGFYQRRFGVPCLNGGTVRLSALIGLSRALDLILTGRSLTAEEAFHWGLANRIVACGTALGQAIQLAGSLVKFPQDCLIQDRKNLYEAAFKGSLEELLQFEKTHSLKVFNQESIEGAKKFTQSDIGKHGKTYYLKKRDIPDWEKD